MKNIILIGFMGSGKTTVAYLLGKMLKMDVVEMDNIVLKNSKRNSINEIFEKDGEIRFRELEIEAAKSIKDLQNTVISTGGGVVMNKIILDYLRQNGVVVYLDTSFYEIQKRLEKTSDRPLFKNVLAARKLFEFRNPLYDFFSEYMVTTNDKDQEAVASEIAKKVKEPGFTPPTPYPSLSSRMKK